MYCAFLLRALGYEDGVDFLYADTLDFAMLHGLFNLSMLDAAPFLRDDLAAVTYQALGADLKDGSTYLLASLVESGRIDAEAAGHYRENRGPTGPDRRSQPPPRHRRGLYHEYGDGHCR